MSQTEARSAIVQVLMVEFAHLRHLLKKKLPFGNLRRLSQNFILAAPDPYRLIDHLKRARAVDEVLVSEFLRRYLSNEITRAFEYFDSHRPFVEETAKANRQLDFMLETERVRSIVQRIVRLDWKLLGFL